VNPLFSRSSSAAIRAKVAVFFLATLPELDSCWDRTTERDATVATPIPHNNWSLRESHLSDHCRVAYLSKNTTSPDEDLHQLRIDGKKLTVKTDIYSLGVTLFYMVSGVLPFQAGTPMALLSKQLNEQPPMLNKISSGISEEFADIVNAMLAKDPEARISIESLIERLRKLQSERDGD
jgi:serine/threonine protein kinase